MWQYDLYMKQLTTVRWANRPISVLTENNEADFTYIKAVARDPMLTKTYKWSYKII